MEEKVEAVEVALRGGPAYLGIDDRDFLLTEQDQLWEENLNLWEKEKELRHEKLLLLNHHLAITESSGMQVHRAAVTQQSPIILDFVCI